MNRKEFILQPKSTESGQRLLPRFVVVLRALRRIPLPSNGEGSQRQRSRHVGCHDARGRFTPRGAEFSRKSIATNRLTRLHDRSGADRPEFVSAQSDLSDFSRNPTRGERHFRPRVIRARRA
jgi:hypothetical protein